MLSTDPSQPELSEEDQERLAIVLDDYLGKLEQGVAPDVDTLCAAHPKLETSIRRYVSSVRLLHEVAIGDSSVSSHNQPKIEFESKQLGDFQLLREVGRGGMGVVFEANQISLGRRVAVKVLPFAAVLDSRQITRFQNEAQAAAQLHHPHIVPVYSIGNDRGTYFYSMQYIEGQSLEQVIRDLKYDAFAFQDLQTQKKSVGKSWLGKRNGPSTLGKSASGASIGGAKESHASSTNRFEEASRERHETSPLRAASASSVADSLMGNQSTQRSIRSTSFVRRVAEIGMQAADALHYAHENGIIHRDIKPSNLLIDTTGRLWVTDFGLAQCAQLGNLTRSGDVLGTLRYMSPEQASGKMHWVDNRSDIYSLGLTLYELLTLRQVVDASDRVAMLRQIEWDDPQGLRIFNPSVSVDLENIILKALSKQREDRYETASELAEDLKRYLEGESPRAQRPNLLDRGQRWVRRHSRVVTAAMVAGLAVWIGSMALIAFVATKNAEISKANLRAQNHLQVANQVVDQFGAGLISELELIPGTERLQSDIAKNSIDYLESFLSYASSDQTLRNEAGQARMKLASLYEETGKLELAAENYRKAQELFGERNRPNPSEYEDIVVAANNEACIMVRLGALAEADVKFRSALRIVESANDALRMNDEQLIGLELRRALLLLNQGYLHSERGQSESARNAIDSAMSILDRSAAQTGLLQNDLGRLLSGALIQCSLIRSLSPRLEQAILEQSWSIARRAASLNPDSSAAEYQVIQSQIALGRYFATNEKSLEAIDWFENAEDALTELHKRHPAQVRVAFDHAVVCNNLGQAHMSLGNYAESRKRFDQSKKELELLGESTTSPDVESSLYGVFHNLGALANACGDRDTAIEFLTKAVECQSALVAKYPDNVRFSQQLTQHRMALEQLNDTQKHSITPAGVNGDNQTSNELSDDALSRDHSLVTPTFSIPNRPWFSGMDERMEAARPELARPVASKGAP